MFDAYKVAVKITLVNEVSKELSAMSAVFGKLGKDVDQLQSKINTLRKIGLLSRDVFGIGINGIKMMAGAIKPAEDYAHQLNIMNMAGMKHKDIAEAVAAAWQTTGTVLTSTATGNLKTFMDLRNVFGDLGGKSGSAAIADMPELVRIGAVLKASTQGSIRDDADNLAFSIAKALDMRNAVSNTTVFNQQAEMMTKVITALQGRVNPEDYRMLFKYGRQAIPGLSNQFLYEELPTFMLEMKGKSGSGGQGGFGTSLAAFYRFFVQGTMSKSSLQGLEAIGLLPMGAGLKTTTTGTQLQFGEHVKNVGLAAKDPFLYTENVLLPLIRKKYGNNLNTEQLNLAIGEIMKGAPQLAIFAVEQYANKAQNVYRDQALIKEAQNSNVAYQMALSSDPGTAMAALNAQWTNFKTAMTMGVIPIIVPAMISLTKYLNEFAAWARKNPNTAKHLVEAIAGVSAAFVLIGTVGMAATTIGIYRLSSAISVLNGVLGAGAVARVGLLAGTVGGAVAGTVGYGVGTLLDKKFHLGDKIGGFLFHLFNTPQGNSRFGSYWHEVNGDNQRREISEIAQQPISVHVDGRELFQAMSPHLDHALNLSNRQQGNNYSSLMTQTPVGTTFPYRA